MGHGGMNRRPRPIIGCHINHTAEHFQEACIPIFGDVMQRGEPGIDEGLEVGTDRFATLPIRNAEIADRILRETVEALPEGLVVNLAELSRYPGVKPEWRAPSPNDVMPMIPLTFVKDGVRLNYFSMITTVGTPQTVTAEELRLECMFPADDATESGHGRFIQTHSTHRSAHH